MFKRSLAALPLCLCLAGTAGAAAIDGTVWLTSGPHTSADVLSVLDGDPLATFSASAIDYPMGDAIRLGGAPGIRLGDFLGTDSASLSGGAGTEIGGGSVFRFSGHLRIDGPNLLFRIAADDGFLFFIDGKRIVGFDSFGFLATLALSLSDLPLGLHAFDLLYWQNGGDMGIESDVGDLAVPAAQPIPQVSLPSALPLLGTGLGLLPLLRLRHRRRCRR